MLDSLTRLQSLQEALYHQLEVIYCLCVYHFIHYNSIYMYVILYLLIEY